MTDYLKIFQQVLTNEAEAITEARERLSGPQLEKLAGLLQMLKSTGGSLVICGVGKSGLVGVKVAATFSSLGLPSFFLHPVEALHGDLGRVTKSDALVFISKSGTTEEIIKLFPYLGIPKERMVAMVGAVPSPIADKCGIVLDCSVKKEACLNNQAPTTSTTVTLAMADAMAVLYEAMTGLSKEEFALNHPGGLLGKALSLRVSDLMLKASFCPTVTLNQKLKDVVLLMTKMPVGMCAVLEKQKLVGVVVEGDIRRALARPDNNGLDEDVKKMMNDNPISVRPDLLAFDALKLMEQRERQISVVPVVDNGQFLGVLRLHDLLKEGLLAP